jgi:hypothetical protein
MNLQRAASVLRRSEIVDLSATPWRRVLLSSKRDVWCLVDADDYAWIMANNWNIGWHARTPWKFYAKRNIGPARSTVYLHREIMLRAQPPASLTLHVDHINGQSLDDRKDNLRWVTPVENRRNSIKRSLIPTLERIVAELAGGLPAGEEVPF